MTFPTRVRQLAVILISLSFTGQAFAVSGSSEFAAGAAAFHEGDYSQALAHFRSARQAGMEKPVLDYNLGVALYRLQRYDEAAEAFRRLLEHPEWQAIANYNLGLVARRQSQPRQARQHFRNAMDTGEPALRELAARELARLGEIPPGLATLESHDILLATAAFGFDDNVISLPDFLQEGASGSGDSFIDALVHGQLAAFAGDDRALELTAFATARQYADFDSFDSTSTGLGVDQRLAWRDSEWSLGANWSSNSVGDESVTDVIGIKLGWRRDFGDDDLAIHLEPRRHSADGRYAHLDGSQWRLSGAWQSGVSYGEVRLRGRLEWNDREDLATATGEFFSYSPFRQRLDFRFRSHPIGNWRWSAAVAAGFSRHDQANTLVDADGNLRTARRESRQLEGQLRAEYRLAKNWRIHAQLRHTDNRDEFALYEYQRNVALLGVEFVNW